MNNRGREIELRAFLKSALDRNRQWASLSGHYNSIGVRLGRSIRYERLHGPKPEHCIRDCVCPKAGILYKGTKRPQNKYIV
jgi:hypothetical protein